VTVEAMKAAKKAGCTVSYDLNYRKKLWAPAEAKKIQEPMMEDVDILITTEEDTHVVSASRRRTTRLRPENWPRPSSSSRGYHLTGRSLRVAKQLDGIAFKMERFSATRSMRSKLWTGSAPVIPSPQILVWVDPVERYPEGVQYGNAFAALKHTVPGDFNWNTLDEVENQIKGAGLRISR